MSKHKIASKSKYVQNTKQAPSASAEVSDSSIVKKAQAFLDSETPAAYTAQVALAILLVSGVAMTLAVLPGLGYAIRHYRRVKYYSDRQLKDAERQLRKKGYIQYENQNGKPRVQLTKKGEVYFQKMLFEDTHLPEPTKWGGKWTFVLFDIPVSHSKARDALRWRLRALGFYQYQKSVWVYPHPCEKEILFVADYFGVGEFVEVLSVEYVSKDAELKKHFNL
jgi:hypothetical protein